MDFLKGALDVWGVYVCVCLCVCARPCPHAPALACVFHKWRKQRRPRRDGTLWDSDSPFAITQEFLSWKIYCCLLEGDSGSKVPQVCEMGFIPF